MRHKIKFPSTYLGWHRYYVTRYNDTEHPDACYLAVLYLFFALREGEVE